MANNTIVSGGEDRKYKLWDCYGRCLYSSLLHDSPIASLSWSPHGELFSVGAFNTLRLCDKSGWSHCLEKPSTGTIGALTWSSDGTQFACACSNGQTLLAQVVNRHLEWHNLEAVVGEDNIIRVKDVLTDAEERLELHDRIVKVSLGWGHLVAITPLQGFIYNSHNWTTPVTFDLKTTTVSLLLLTDRHFLMADNVSGLLVYSYEGRLMSTVKYPRGSVASLSVLTVSISVDTIAIRDKKEEKVVHLFDVASGKELREGKPLCHKVEIVSLSLSQSGPGSQRQLAFLDQNHDLFLTLARETTPTQTYQTVSLGGMVGSIAWNDRTNMLAAVTDGRLAVWYHPLVAFTNKDLLPQTLVRQEDSNFKKSAQLVQFVGNCCTLRRDDGALITTSVSPFPAILHQHAASSKWDAATKLCRFVKDPALWACLAGMATNARDLNTAEVAYAAVNEIDKVHYIAEIKALPSAECRNAELALFSHRPQHAEAIYLQAGMVYRAIQLNIDLFNWERALQLALKHKTHVDTVLAFREKHLTELGSKETLAKVIECQGKVKIDWDTIRTKIENEENRGLQ
jgi:intraflagellar transport protein 80